MLEAGEELQPALEEGTYGRGIRMHWSMEDAHEDAHRDSTGGRQVFAALVLPGKSKFVARNKGPPVDVRLMIGEGFTSHMDDVSVTVYEESCVLVSLLITYRVAPERTTPRHLAFGGPVDYAGRVDELAKPGVPDSLLPVCMTSVGIDLWLLPFLKQWQEVAMQRKKGLLVSRQHTHLVLVVDRSVVMGDKLGKDVMPACSDMFAAIQPDEAHVVFFGETVETTPVKDAAFFKGKGANMTSEGGSALHIACERALSLACSSQERVREEETAKRHAIVADCCGATRMSKKAVCGSIEKEYSCAMVIICASHDTTSTPAQAESIRAKGEKWVRGSRMALQVRSLAVGSKADAAALAQLRGAWDTLQPPRSPAVYYSKRTLALPRAVKSIVQDICGTLATHTALVTVETPLLTGFLTRACSEPVQATRVRLDGADDVWLAFKGTHPPHSLLVNGVPVTIQLSRHFPRTATALHLLQGFALDVRVAVAAGRKYEDGAKAISDVAAALRLSLLPEGAMSNGGRKRAAVMAANRQAFVELAQITNSVADARNIAMHHRQRLSSSKIARWLADVQGMRHGKAAMRRAATAPSALDATPSVGEEAATRLHAVVEDLKRLHAPVDMPPGAQQRRSELSSMTAVEHLQEIVTDVRDHLEASLPEIQLEHLLYAYGMVGVGIRVRRCQASAVNPWMLDVQYVASSRSYDTAGALCALHMALPVTDPATGEVVEDVLVLPEADNPGPALAFCRSLLHRHYLAAVVTRNPLLMVPEQLTALRMLSLAAAVRQLLDREPVANVFVTASHLRVIDDLIRCLRMTMARARIAGDGRWERLLQNCWREQPGRFLTEAEGNNLSSVAEVLAMLLCWPGAAAAYQQAGSVAVQDTGGIETTAKARFAIALIAEGVSRDVRAKVRAEAAAEAAGAALGPARKQKAHQLLQHALKITESSVPQPQTKDNGSWDGAVPEFTAEYALGRAQRDSGRFFAKAQASRGPRAVVACLEFVEIYQTALDETGAGEQPLGAARDRLLATLVERCRDMTMAQFLRRHAPHASAAELQSALYAQALRHHTSKERKEGLPSLLGPSEVLAGLAKVERRLIFEARVQELLRKQRAKGQLQARQERHARLLLEQQAFLAAHAGAPRFFSHKEVAAMNVARTADDQLELTASHLLKGRCCFVTCPLYLRDLRTEADKALGTRKGLHRHLSMFLVPRRAYVPGLHLRAMQLWSRHKGKGGCGLSQAQFAAELLQQVAADPHATRVPFTATHVKATAKAFYERMSAAEAHE